MGKNVNQPHGGALYRPAKGETANRRGRPRKFISQLKDTGYAQSEVNDAIRVLLSMTEKELGGVSGNPDATILEKTIAGALRRGVEEGSLDAIESLLSRTYGRPHQSKSISGGPQELVIVRRVVESPYRQEAAKLNESNGIKNEEETWDE